MSCISIYKFLLKKELYRFFSLYSIFEKGLHEGELSMNMYLLMITLLSIVIVILGYHGGDGMRLLV